MKRLILPLCAVALACQSVFAGGSVVPVGTYLYAKPENPEQYTGRLTVRFETPGDRLVVAWGRKWRKDRKARKGTKEEDRQKFKPYLGKPIDDGKGVIFWNLPIDRYDIVVIDPKQMKVHEGIMLMRDSDPNQPLDKFLGEVRDCLGPREDVIGGWEGFFDHKEFDRLESNGVRAGVFLQQMRLRKALAESGAVLKGCIHSIDVVWVERAKVEGVGWQVVSRQQLYRDEIPARTFFAYTFVPELSGIRMGTKPKEIGPIKLP
jgi:hypothetical protein